MQLLTDNSEHTGVWMQVDPDHVRLIGGLTDEGKIYVLPDAERGIDMPREYADKVWGPLEDWLYEIPVDGSDSV